MDDPILKACKALFDAYDVDENGELTREEYLQIEMRICFDKGEVFKGDSAASNVTRADVDHSGTVDFVEFRDRQLRKFTELGMVQDEIIAHLNDATKDALQQRTMMGARFHPGIRQTIKKIFHLYDVSGDGSLSPEEWVSAQKIIASELNDEVDESWIDEATFASADTNGDGMIQLDEYVEACFQMFENLKLRTDELMTKLLKIKAALEKGKSFRDTEMLEIMLQAADKPDFQPPKDAWQDEPTEEALVKGWKCKAELKLSKALQTAEDVNSVIRMSMQLPADTWISTYFLMSNGQGVAPTITLMRDSNAQEALDLLCKPSSCKKLFVKNVRVRPRRLLEQPAVWGDEREALLMKRTGEAWGIDWETQLVGLGEKLPPSPMQVVAGNTVVIEVPNTDDGGQYTFRHKVFCDSNEILSSPVEEVVEVKVKKKKQKKGAAAPDAFVDQPIQLSFVALKEGKCCMFVDVMWDDQEEKLCSQHNITQPVQENSIARIGPFEVEVGKPDPRAKPPGKDTPLVFKWWNGEKWTPKKGPAGKKKKK